MTAFVYLHGFASGPRSGKARFFRERFRALGHDLETPDLNEGLGGFRALTVTRMLGAARAAGERARARAGLAPDAPLVLLGSSLGGYVSALLAARDPTVAALVLLAPAFEFPRRFGAALERDGPRDAYEIHHYAYGRPASIGRGLLLDGRGYEGFPYPRCPALIAHGVRDDSVPIGLSRDFRSRRPGVLLLELPDGHQLHETTGTIWAEVRRFLSPWIG